jgi:hypothetical protein
LERIGKDRIWTSLLKNSFSPMLIGKFDFVVGNPPWINWQNLPEFYRNATKGLWDTYGLLETAKGKGLGKVKRDMAMLFTARCLDLYAKSDAHFAFLIPFTSYKTQAGAGFRRFLAFGAGDTVPCRVTRIHDLVTLYPFEGAINRTSLLVIEKTGRTQFPIPCTTWQNPTSTGVDQEADLQSVFHTTQQSKLIFTPIQETNPSTPWMQIAPHAVDGIRKAVGESPWYEAHEGVNTALNGVYWIQIVSKEPNGLLISNPPIPGQKKRVRQVTHLVDTDFVYPFLRGKDVKKWRVLGDLGWIILPHDSRTGKVIDPDTLKLKFRNTFLYFAEFKTELEKRSLHKLWGKANPFYTVYGIGDYTFYPFKVVWKRVAGKISGKAEFSAAVISITDDRFLGLKSTIPYEKLMLIPFRDEAQAHFVAAVLNSSILRTVVASYLIETTISDITKRIRIPRFDHQNPLHEQLSEYSIQAHKLAASTDTSETTSIALLNIEDKIDDCVARVYGITPDQLDDINATLRILQGQPDEDEDDREQEE